MIGHGSIGLAELAIEVIFPQMTILSIGIEEALLTE